jgi:hypothetical protein
MLMVKSPEGRPVKEKTPEPLLLPVYFEPEP